MNKNVIKIFIILIACAMGFLYMLNKRYYYMNKSVLIRIDNWTGEVDWYNSRTGYWETYK